PPRTSRVASPQLAGSVRSRASPDTGPAVSALDPGKARMLPSSDRATVPLGILVALEAFADVVAIGETRFRQCRRRGRRSGAGAANQEHLGVLRHPGLFHLAHELGISLSVGERLPLHF